MSVKIGDAVKLHAGAGQEVISATVEAVHESGAIDAKLTDGQVTYALPGNFDVEASDTPKAAPAPVAAIHTANANVTKVVPAHVPKVTKQGQFTTITR